MQKRDFGAPHSNGRISAVSKAFLDLITDLKSGLKGALDEAKIADDIVSFRPSKLYLKLADLLKPHHCAQNLGARKGES